MIVYLEGELLHSTPLHAVILANGVGYGVHIPLRVSEGLPAKGGSVKLHIRQVFREDSADLFGFFDATERDFFDLLTKVSGIGPKTALTLLSRVPAESLASGIASSDTIMLSQCPGIGKKTAERIVVELRDKVPSFGIPSSPAGVPEDTNGQAMIEEAAAALVTLGFKPVDAKKAVERSLRTVGDSPTTEKLVKLSLR
ncbi:MAG: Holliday junction branch migration protein RuvA [Verrucomicrobiota bacterium]